MKPTLNKIKKHFKDAKQVKCLLSGEIKTLLFTDTEISETKEFKEFGSYWIGAGARNILVFDNGVFADIIS